MEFQKAKALWAKDRTKERNCELSFLTVVPREKNCRVFLATSGIYQIWVNQKFLAAGPARAAHGYFRVDEYSLWEVLTEEENEVEIKVLGYNVNSYDTLNQPSFLTAEIRNQSGVLAWTGGECFHIYDRRERVRKVQRYSFQRAFIDNYRLTGKKTREFSEEKQEILSDPQYIAREVRYPEFSVLKVEAILLEGKAYFGNRSCSVIREEEYFKTGDQLLGFSYEEVEEHVSEEAQRIIYVPEKGKVEKPREKYLKNSYALYRFPYNGTGFYRIAIKAQEHSRIFVQFDEILTGEDIDFLRMYSCNCFVYTVPPGKHQLMSFAPYTMKYLKVTVHGDCVVEQVELVEYKHPQPKWTICLSKEEKELWVIYEAALESYQANSLDVFMDCPSRERSGWLCDSYFTSEVEWVLTGESILERAFLENFLMNESFAYLPEGMLPMCYPADHNNGNYIPNWAMWFVLELEKYVGHTADQKLARQAKPVVERLLHFFSSYENEFGLLENLEGWVFVEWSRANDRELVNGVNFPSNMLYAKMLQAAGKLYGNLMFLEKAEKLRETIRKRARRGIFYTDHEQRTENGWENSGECTEVCQYYAFFTGVASWEADQTLWELLKKEFGPGRRESGRYPQIAFTNAFIGNYLRLELLYQRGLYEEMLDNITALFLPMAEKTGTLWEHEKPTGSCNHGFASYVISWLAKIYGSCLLE